MTARTLTQTLRRGVGNGLIAGIVIVFLVLIGLPGGAGDESILLPPAVAWALLITVAVGLGYLAARPRGVVEQRSHNLGGSLIAGLAVGIAAAAVTVAMMVILNNMQLWEASRPRGGEVLASGLRTNINRVQDIFFNVTPRTTAVMAGMDVARLSETPRPDPTSGFIGMSLLLVIAGVVGGGLTFAGKILSAARSGRSENPTMRTVREWLPIALPGLLFLFIVLNSTTSLLGENKQLAGLLAAFFMIAAGLISLRQTHDFPDALNTFGARFGALAAIAIAFTVIGLLAPRREASDLGFSERTPELVQVESAAGVTVITEAVPKASLDNLHTLRSALVVLLGAAMLVGGYFRARSKASIRGTLAMLILVGAMMITPMYLDRYQLSVMLLVGINILLGLGLNIVVGYVGLLDLGYVAYYAIGAYTYSFLTSNQDIRNGPDVIGLKFGGNDQMMQNTAASVVVGLAISLAVVLIGMNLWRILKRPEAKSPSSALRPQEARSPRWYGYALVAISVVVTMLVVQSMRGTALYESFGEFPMFLTGLLVSVIVAAGVGGALGIPVLRLRGDYLAIVTLGFGEIVRRIFNNLKDITGGPQGVVSIPKPSFGPVEVGSNEGLLYLVLFGCVIVSIIALRLKSSRVGRAWGAVKSDEDIAQAMGVNPFLSKVFAYALGAGLAAAGGVFYATRQTSIFPANFSLDVSINVLSLVIIGGMGSIPGVIVGALVLIGVPESLRIFSTYRVLAFGALLVAMMILRPRGLLPEPPHPLEKRAKALAGKQTEPAGAK